MAGIPTISPLGTGDAPGASVSQRLPLPTDFQRLGARAQGEAFAELGRGISEFGETVTRIANDNARHSDALATVRLTEEAKRRTAIALAEIDPLAEDFEAQVEERFGEIRADIEDRAPTGTSRGQKDFELALERAVQTARGAAALTRREALIKETGRELRVALDATLAEIRQNPDAAAGLADEFAETFGRLSPNIPGGQIPALLEVADDAMIRAKAEGLALAGRTNEAKSFLDGAQDRLTPANFRALKNIVTEIDNRRRNEFNAQTDVDVANFRTRISDATNVSELAGIRAELEVAKEGGLFEDRAASFPALVEKINARQRSIITAGRDLQAALAKVASGRGLDTTKEAGLVWTQWREAVGRDVSAEGILQLGVGFARTTGLAPPEHKSIVTNAERAESIDLLSAAVQVARAYQDADTGAPGVNIGLGVRVETAMALSDISGMSPTDASQRVLARIPDAATVKARDEEFDTLFGPDLDVEEFLIQADIVPGFSFLGADISTEDVVVPARVAAEVERTLRTFFRLHGSEDVARAAAASSLARRFGMDRTGLGKPVLRRNPVTRFFPGAENVNLELEDKVRIVNSDITRMLKDLALEAPDLPPGLEDLPVFALISDERTQREIAAEVSPSYELRVRDAAGLMVPLLFEGPGGLRQRQRFTMYTTEELARDPEFLVIQEEREAEAADLKKFGNPLLPPTSKAQFRARLRQSIGPVPRPGPIKIPGR